ncbi:FecCD family ABC transporter permease [Ensifer soli]|uniref:FecCD family ABC transporter permease n=1 Tax=Ciceribacter sp. sgz301302 TaxID=3342379 RepID=UPI0035B911AE
MSLAVAVRAGDAGILRRTAPRSGPVLGALGLLLCAACLVSLATGPSGVSLGELALYLYGTSSALTAQQTVIIEAVRLPRTLLGLLAGAGLGLSGAMLQGLFRNPLADPGLVGVTSGAAMAAVAAIVLGTGLLAPLTHLFGVAFLPLMAFLGALLNTSLLYLIATQGGRTSTASLILAGIALGALASAVTGLMIFSADDTALRDITFWSLGSLGGATMTRVLVLLPFVGAVVLLMPFVARGLDALVLGEAAAFHMGVPVQRLKRLVIVGVAAACGATVAMTGSIAFVGIIVPHLVRLVLGPAHRRVLPASALGGAALMLLADSLARVVAAPAELPIGIITALLGTPVFLMLLVGRPGRARIEP